MSALDEKTRAERALKDLQKVQVEDMVMPKFADICSMFYEGADIYLGLFSSLVAC